MYLKPSINSIMNLPAEQNNISVGKSMYEKCQATSVLAKVGQRIPEAVEKASSAPGSTTGGRRGEGRVSNSYQCSPRDTPQPDPFSLLSSDGRPGPAATFPFLQLSFPTGKGFFSVLDPLWNMQLSSSGEGSSI